MTLFAALVLIEGVFLWFAQRRVREASCPSGRLAEWPSVRRGMCVYFDTPLQTHIAVNLLLIAVYGGRLMAVGPAVTNVGTVLYANVMAAQYLIVRQFGWRAGIEAVGIMLAALLMHFAVTSAFPLAPPVPGNEFMAGVYQVIATSSYRFAAAAFMGFLASQMVFVVLYRRWQKRGVWLHYGAAVVIAQAVDSLIFFPVAFGIDDSLLETALTGFAVKAALGLAIAPVLKHWTT